MSEITAVPIAPVRRSWIVLLGGGVALAALGGLALAWAGTGNVVANGCKLSDFPGAKGSDVARLPSGLFFRTVKAGAGGRPTESDVTLVDYRGTLRDGKVFDANQRTPLPVKGMIPGFSEALKMMQPGGEYRFCIPPQIGYGARTTGPIPANSTLMFDVTLLDFRSEAEIQAMQAQMQQLQGTGAPLPNGAVPVPGGR